MNVAKPDSVSEGASESRVHEFANRDARSLANHIGRISDIRGERKSNQSPGRETI